jgi:AraC family transcriptional regulator
MDFRIETLKEKKLIGKRVTMSYSNNKTLELWRSFMPRRNEIRHMPGNELFSLQIYPPIFFESFNPDTEFEKWAAIEVTDYTNIPHGMETLTLTGGLYAGFLYKGAASASTSTFQYILGPWLANSEYLLDNRPHFELLGENYKNEDPDSEEEIWIPVKLKK